MDFEGAFSCATGLAHGATSSLAAGKGSNHSLGHFATAHQPKLWFDLIDDVSCPAEGPGRLLSGRHLSVQAFAAFSLIAYFGLCSTVTAAGVPAFAAYGSVSGEWFEPGGTTRYKCEADLTFSYGAGLWQIDLDIKSPADQAGQHKSCKRVPEGVRYFTEFGPSAGPPVGDTPLTAAVAEPIAFPPPEDTSLLCVWLSLCPSPALPIIGPGRIRAFMPLRLMLDPRNKATYSAEYLASGSVFLSKLLITNNGLVFQSDADPVRYPTPFGGGFFSFAYEVLDRTNIAGVSFPLTSEVRYLKPRPGAERVDDLYLASVQKLNVRKVEFLSNGETPSKPVSHPPLLLALDQRPPGLPMGVTVDHLVTNDEWLSITNQRLANLATVYRQMRTTKRSGKNAGYLLLFLVLTGAPAAALWFRRHKTINKHTQRTQKK
jgi:hypothetical protein